MNLSEAELLALLVADLETNFKDLVAAYQHRLFAFISRQTGSRQDTEDIVQETFLHAYFALGNYPTRRIQTLKVLPWLFRIALNIFYSHQRATKVASVPLDLSEDGPQLEMADDCERPDIALEKREEFQTLQAYLTDLPGPYREAINLYYFEGIRYQEIADLLNMPIGTVKSNLHRGLRLLRRSFETDNETHKKEDYFSDRLNVVSCDSSVDGRNKKR
jgi:RNA polymerase sigma-70 factor, ECF subfamily